MKKKLQEELRAVMGQLKTYRDLTEPTEEQTKEFDANLDKQEQLLADIKACDEREARALALEAQSRASVNPLPAGGPAPVSGGHPTPSGRSIVIPATARRKAPKGFDSAEQAFAMGRFLQATLGGNSQARQWVQDHGYNVTRAQTENNNAEGGYFVPGEFGSVIDSLIADYGVIRQYATESVMTRDTKDHPKTPLLIRFVSAGELATMAVNTARNGNLSLVAKKAYLLLQRSSELSEDAAISVAELYGRLIAESAAYSIDDYGFNGDGTDTYIGITGIFNRLNGVASNAGVVTLTGADTYAEVTRTQLVSIKAKLPAAAAANGDPAWYVSRKGGIEMMERIALEQGGATAAEILSGANPRFLGDPVRIVNAITDAETSGGFAFAYGSLRKGVVFGNRRELTVVSSMEAGFLTDSEYDRATMRLDINVHEPGTSSAVGALVVGKFA
jgi:HK97 family phage major capsid protein